MAVERTWSNYPRDHRRPIYCTICLLGSVGMRGASAVGRLTVLLASLRSLFSLDLPRFHLLTRRLERLLRWLWFGSCF